MEIIIGLAALIAIIWVSARDWHMAIKAVLVIAVLEGALRKWVLPQVSDLVYFLKDLVLLGAYLRYFSSKAPKYPMRLSILTIVLCMTLGWCIVQAFNPSLGSPLASLMGLKAYFYYIPMMWMVPTLFPTEAKLLQFLRRYLILAIPVCLLAVAQFFSPASSPLNVYASGQEATAIVGTFVRVTGTFSYLAGYSTYLGVCFSLLIPLLTSPQPLLWRLLTMIEAFLVVGTSFMTGARSLLLFEILFLIAYIGILGITNPKLAFRSMRRFIIPILLILAIIPRYFSTAIDAFLSRVQSAGDSSSSRAFSALTDPIEATQYKGIDGFGTGATHQATSGLRAALQLPPGEALPPAEGETGRIVLELGPFGFILWYTLRIILIGMLLQVFLRLKTPFLRQLALVALLFQAINITSFLVFNHTFAVYFWFFSGFIFLLPQLEYQQGLKNT